MYHSRFQPVRASVLSAAAVLAPLATPAAAQKSDAEARAEITFARGLASDWGFVDLSEEVIRDLENDGVSSKLKEELGLLKCDIYFVAAKNDKNRRDELLQKSLESYEEFVARNAFSDYLADAETSLIEVASYYAKWLALQMETAAGEEGESLQTEMQRVLDGAVDKTGDLIDGLKSIPPDDRTEADRRKLFGLLYNRGELLLELAKTQEDGTYSFESSFRAFENLVDEAGEASPWGLRAFIGIGDNLMAQGEYDEASGYYEFVVEMAITRDKESWATAREDMTQDELEQRFLFLQMGTAGLVDAAARAGRPEEAADWGLHFYNSWKREGLSLVQPVGHLALLGVASSLVDAGGVIGGAIGSGEGEWFATDEQAQAEYRNARDRRTALDLALGMAQSVNTENKGNTLQLRAQKVISDIISRPGVQVDPEILFEAAQGEYYEKSYIDAITSFKRVLTSLEGKDQATRTEIGSKTLWHIGRCFQNEDRTLEAAIAFREGVDDRWRGDPYYDAENAGKYYDTMRALRNVAKDDPIIEEMWRDAEDKAKQFTETKGAEVAYRQASELYSAGETAQALEAYKAVEANAESYEKALVFVGVCHYKLGQLDNAEKAFDAYVHKFLENPINTTTDNRKLAKRSEATATAWFYWGLVAYKRAGDGSGPWDDVVAKLGDFHKRFPDQTSFAPAALYRVMIAQTKMGDNTKARAVYDELLAEFPDSQWTGRTSSDFYAILKAQQEEESDEARKVALEREMAEALQVLNKTSPSPSFTNMRAESRHWMRLGEWETAEELLNRIKLKFAEDPEVAGDVEGYVIPDLGRALLRQYKVEAAAAELKSLVDEKKANRETARTYGLALTGWLELDESSGSPVIKQAQGVGGQEGFEAGTKIINQLTESSEEWETKWYEFKLDQIYSYYQWGQIDGKKLDTAKRSMSFLTTNLGVTMKHELMPEATRQKYLWLAGELK